MNLETNLHGRLRNTSLPYSNGLLPLFEAVGNSIHAIEEAGLSSTDGKIVVKILRDSQMDLAFEKDNKKRGRESRPDIVGFEITDNGIGFDDDNMKSFLTLDTEHKVDKGGRGVGRLLWLKAFERANIRSVYRDKEGHSKLRSFSFSSQSAIHNEKTEDAGDTRRETTVHLDGFRKKYREASHKTAQPIANNLFEHCLWYFIREGGAPNISIVDDDEVIDLNEVYDSLMISSAKTDTIDIKGKAFDLIHIKLRAKSNRTHSIAFCAANRVVQQDSIRGKIPGLFGPLRDETGDFLYECYVSSPFLDKRVRSERTSFDIEEEPLELYSDALSQKDIREGVLARVAEHLSEYLDENKKKGRDRIESFVSQRAPRYRPILNKMPEEQLSIDPDTPDKDLELHLHKHLAEIEEHLIAEGHDVMHPKEHESYEDYHARLKEYLDTAETIKMSDLASYVSHRKVILDLLEMAIRRKDDGRYEREDLIHELIMPMRTDSREVMLDSCNLWLVDERLAFHDYLASDKTLASMPITDSTETKEPDIVALNVFDNPILVSEGTSIPLASVVVIELKKPMRNDAAQGEEKDPIEQALGYLDRIRRGKVTTASGRLIPESETIPGYCYVLCDITPSVEARCRMHDGVKTDDGLGYFFYHDTFSAYVEVMSFDRLVNAAKERNRAFFDKLGLPTT